MKRILIFLCFGMKFLIAQSTVFQMDGLFEDWQDVQFIEKDANPSNSIDLVELSASNDEAYLYLRIKVDREILFQESNLRIWIDADNNAGTGQRVRNIGSELYYHFGQRWRQLSGQDVGHFDISLVSFPTHSSDEFEVRIQRQGVLTASTIQIIVAGISLTEDALPTSGSLSYVFDEGPFPAYTSSSIAQEDPAYIRLMNYNILFGRPLEAAYRSQFERVVRAVNADIYCFNEFYDASASTVKALMDAVWPTQDPVGWYVSKVDGDNVTASRYPILQSIDISDVGNMTASLIKLPDHYDTDLLVIVCHFSCCEQETERQLQVDAVAAFIEEAKTPGGRITVAENTPILITGDFNMVGLQQQRTTLLTGDIQNTDRFGMAGMPDWDDSPLSDLIPYLTEQPVATTWINPFSSFSPGRLDYMLYSDSRLEAKKSFILKTDEMSVDTLAAYNLEVNDTDFSDHLPIVGDFEIVELTTSTDDIVAKKSGLSLSPAFPNPTSGITNFPFRLEQSLKVQFQILGVGGQLIETLVDKILPAGEHLVEWNSGYLPSGVYFFRIITEKGTITEKFVKR